MESKLLLVEQLSEYRKSDAYPFHMPGHKRKASSFPNPYEIDITEIEGFDNLHHPEGILKDSMEWAASVYGADHTFYLINGSSSGILSGICAVTRTGGKLLMSRNCHKSAYHGVILNQLETEYVYPQIIGHLGIQGGILAVDVEKQLQNHPDIQAVLVVSPTYDGVVSDITGIAAVVHKRGIPLLVDEAHGAHLSFGEAAGFPPSALTQGADIVIQSLHKTLPSFTQTALLHVKEGYVNIERLKRYLQMFQSSSPSYVLMAGIERCIWDLEQDGTRRMKEFYKKLMEFRNDLGQMKHAELMGENICGKYGISRIDPSKIVISARGCTRQLEGRTVPVDGVWMISYLRKEHHLEMEMCGSDYVVALTSLNDTADGFGRLKEGLLRMDNLLVPGKQREIFYDTGVPQMTEWTLSKAMDEDYEEMELAGCVGHISGEFIYLYPPGIPIIAPGEVITKEIVKAVLQYHRLGMPVQGMTDESVGKLRVLSGKKKERSK